MKNRPLRWWDWLAVPCLFISIWLPVFRMTQTGWTSDLYKVESSAIIGLLIGMALGYSIFRPRTVFWLGLGYTLMILSWQFDIIVGLDQHWLEKFSVLQGRLSSSISLFFHNQPVKDALLFLFITLVVYWFLSILAGYQFVRYGKPWVPLIISGILLCVIDYFPPYVQFRTFYTGCFFFFALITVGRLYYLHSFCRWKEKGATIENDVGYDLGKGILYCSAAIVIVAWSIPNLIDLFVPGSDTQRFFERLWAPIRSRLSNAVVELRSPPSNTYVEFFGNDLALGNGISSSSEIIFSVEVDEKVRIGKQFYWRGQSYDTYENGGWKNTLRLNPYKTMPGVSIQRPSWEGRVPVQLIFILYQPLSGMIYTPLYPLVLDQEANIKGIEISPSEGYDIVSISTESSLPRGWVIVSTSWVSNLDAEMLRQSSQDYPEWVRQRYLQIPDGFSEKIKNLAKTLTADQPTPFDKATAITRYLRENIKYSQYMQDIPSNWDPLEWFLFGSKEGFCNYYATVEVLMLRSVGIPARLTVGFAEGSWDSKKSAYMVRYKDTHAWPEVFFNEYGWVEVEPTTAQPINSYMVEQKSQEEPRERFWQNLPNPNQDIQKEREEKLALNNEAKDQTGTIFTPAVLQTILLIDLALLISVLIWVAMRRSPNSRVWKIFSWIETTATKSGMKVPRWLKYLSWRAPLSGIEKYFADVLLMLGILGVKTNPGGTPGEYVEQLIEALPQTDEQVSVLLKEYESSMYGPVPGNDQIAQKALIQLWWIVFKSIFNPQPENHKPVKGY